MDVKPKWKSNYFSFSLALFVLFIFSSLWAAAKIEFQWEPRFFLVDVVPGNVQLGGPIKLFDLMIIDKSNF